MFPAFFSLIEALVGLSGPKWDFQVPPEDSELLMILLVLHALWLQNGAKYHLDYFLGLLRYDIHLLAHKKSA